MITKVRGLRYNNGEVLEMEEAVVVEDTVYLYLNNRLIQKNVASRENLEELGAGFFIASGMIQESDLLKVSVEGMAVFVEADEKKIRSVENILESCGGAGLSSVYKPLADGGTISPAQIFEMREALNSLEWGETGGLHCAVLYCKTEKAAIFSDIGRHNTVDKCIGYMALHKLNPLDCSIACTGREPAGMVYKAVNAGIPILVSRAAATSAGISAAKDNNLTLICFTRDKRFTVYANPKRIQFS